MSDERDYNYRDAILKALADGKDHYNMFYELEPDCLARRRAFARDLEALVKEGLAIGSASDEADTVMQPWGDE